MRIVVAVALLLSGCVPAASSDRTAAMQAEAVDPAAGPLPVLVTTRELMGGLTAFSAHVIESIATSTVSKAPSEWDAVSLAASDLAAASSLMTMNNDNVVDNMRRSDGHWRLLSKALQDAALEVRTAARARDAAALLAASSDIRQACRSCHAQYRVHGE